MIKTKRWDEPREPDDGFRLLVCRYRPRALHKAKETWDAWDRDLGPSVELHADFYGKRGKPPLTWEQYERRYLEEMRARGYALARWKDVARAKTLTLLCSSRCVDPARCHRTLLARLLGAQPQ